MAARTLLAATAIALLGCCAFFLVTYGFATVTSEGARRLAVLRNPAPLPEIALIDGASAAFSLARPEQPERVLIVDFVYTRCLAVCSALGGSFQQLQRQLADTPTVGLLSISFDPAIDTPDVLAAYGRRLGADPARWRFARVADARDLPTLLKRFGVVVIPDGLGGFQHNAALHVIHRGRLLRIFEYDQAEAALAFAQQQAETSHESR